VNLLNIKDTFPSVRWLSREAIQKKFNAGEFQVQAALIIGKRKASTDLKTSLNNALRDFNVTV
jgi:hypothetical protein